jgi:SAM-dependent methyltransferase
MSQDARPDYTGSELDAMSVAVNYHRWILEEFMPYLGRSVAEVGAGIGSVSRLLLNYAAIDRLVAFEPSNNMFPHLEAELRGERRAAAVNDFFSAKYAQTGFDSVVYINVMEHIADDRQEMATACSALRPNGHVLIFVPALPWLYSEFDRQIGHFRRYTKATLQAAAQKAGLVPVKLRYFDAAGILPWFVNFKLLRRGGVGNSVAVYDRLVVPPMKRFERLVPPPLGKNLLLVARKN